MAFPNLPLVHQEMLLLCALVVAVPVLTTTSAPVDEANMHLEYQWESPHLMHYGREMLKMRSDTFCEGEKATINCPAYTQITVENVFYGHSSLTEQICNGKIDSELKLRKRAKWKLLKKKKKKRRRSLMDENASCVLKEAHAFVSEICNNKRKCRMKTGVKGGNECQRLNRHLRVDYKCRPSQFNSEFFCENQLMNLTCAEEQLLAIHSAHYRSVPPNGSGNCRRTSSSEFVDCSTDVLPILAEKCQARQSCQLPIGRQTFVTNCPLSVETQLAIVFICVDRSVFVDQLSDDQLTSDQSAPSKSVPGAIDSSATMSDAAPEGEEEDSGSATSTLPYTPSMSFSSASSVRRSFQAGNNMTNSTASRPPDDPSSSSSPSPNIIGLVKAFALMWNYMRAHVQQAVLSACLSAGCALLLMVVFGICQRCRPVNKAATAGHIVNAHASKGRRRRRRKRSLDKGAIRKRPPSALTVALIDDDQLESVHESGVSFIRFSNLTPPHWQSSRNNFLLA